MLMLAKMRVVAVALACSTIAACMQSSSASASTRCPLPTFGPGEDYLPQIDAKSFSADVTNPWFPLKPRRTLVYTGTEDSDSLLDIFTATSRTKKIEGVVTRVVEDRVYRNNVLQERTSDYYAQDRCGNVWYFGEDTAELDAKGHVTSTEGTWRTGVHGARPGVFMQHKPELGREFRQEWLAGQAEDRYKVVDLSTSVTVPAGTFHHVLRTEERTDLEAGVLDNKYYARGIGTVEEATVAGGTEKLVLVEIIE
jgi:hypothetical protein